MSGNVGRVLTLVVRIENDAEANAIWDAHLHNKTVAGAKITGIADGDLIQEREELYSTLSERDLKEDDIPF